MYKSALLTISDKCSSGDREDKTGSIVQDLIESLGLELIAIDIIPDDIDEIKDKLINFCDNLKVDLIITNGGTGFSERDNTPEATSQIINKPVPGIPEAMRSEGFNRTSTAILSRGIAGIRNKTLIINLPGSPKGAKESLEVILPSLIHGLDMIAGKEH